MIVKIPSTLGKESLEVPDDARNSTFFRTVIQGPGVKPSCFTAQKGILIQQGISLCLIQCLKSYKAHPK